MYEYTTYFSEIYDNVSLVENDLYYVKKTTETVYSVYIAQNNALIYVGTSVPKLDLTDYQTIEDDELETTDKTIVGAINEVLDEVSTELLSKVSVELGGFGTRNVVKAINTLYNNTKDSMSIFNSNNKLVSNKSADVPDTLDRNTVYFITN